MNETLGEGVFYTCRSACKDTAFLVVGEIVGGEGRWVGDVVNLWSNANFGVGETSGGG